MAGLVPNRTAPTPTLGVLRQRREDILRLAAQHAASNVRVFGSVARNEAVPGSDVDLLVDLAPDLRGFALFASLRDLAADLENLLGVPVDVVRISVPSPRAEAILLEAVPL
jgi:predicted nucleotidyltransferase